ncbi:DUF4352 domain-containing protein [Listeria booriae]|uniref:DUF4352 domain-containing protein n=1 Tax=Listeria booriae TaxID=1552123 RepID=A0A099VWM9_9LIST|nr:DUF4352 domain-containing protein [Listeria booriae]KGL37939.1 hypothetical protein EP57_15385 [Listeria booriae]STY45936.1 Telomeric repeat-binding factor 2 [Listeria booriae]
MKKLLIVGLTIGTLLGTAACTNNDASNETKTTQTETQKETKKSEVNQVKTINDMAMKITSDDIVKDDTLKKDQSLLAVHFDIKNNGKVDNGVGAGDFYVKDANGKKYLMTGHEDNFGDVIKPGKELKGIGYYAIPKDAKNLTMVYDKAVDTSKNEKTLEWYIGTPKQAK